MKKTSPDKSKFSTEFEYFLVENAFGYQGVQMIRISGAGLVYVLGKNMQSLEESSSGAGKSRIWSLLLYLFFGKVALGSNESIKDADIFGKDFRIEAVFKRYGKRFLTRETRNHSNPKYEKGLHTYEIGTDNKLRPWERAPKNDPGMMRKKLQKLLSWTYKEAVGTIVWPQNFGHALVEGKPAERISFLSDLYGLTRYDEVHEQLDNQHKEIKNKIASLLEFKAEYKFVEDSVKKAGDVRAVAESAKALASKISQYKGSVEAKRKELSAIQTKIVRFNELADQINRFSEFQLDSKELGLVSDGKLLSEFDRSCETVRSTLQKYQDAADGIKKLSSCRSKLDAIGSSSYDASKLRAEERKIVDSLQGLRRAKYSQTDIDVLEQSMDVLKERIKELCTELQLRPDPQEIKEAHVAATCAVTTHTNKMAMLDATKKTLTTLSSSVIRKNGKCRCPTCNQHVDEDRVKLITDDLSKQLSKLDAESVAIEDREAKIEELMNSVADWKRISETIYEAKEALKDDAELTQGKERLATIRNEIQKLEQHQSLSAEFTMLNTKYGKLDQNKMQRGVTHYLKIVEENENRRSRYYEVTEASVAVKASAEALSIDDPFDLDIGYETKRLEQERAQLSVWIETASKKLDNGLVKLQQYRQVISDYREKKSHLDELRIQMAELKKLEEREYVLSNTKAAYAKNGLKLEQLQKLLKSLAERLPYWTRVLFTEKDFSVKVKGDDLGLSLVVPKTFELGKKKVVKEIDISLLSGGERSRMAVCLMLTMSELVSRDKRTNFLVLDEVDRHLDPYAQRLMADLLIPMMRSRKEGLFVISHSTLIDTKKFDRSMIVTKRKNNVTDIKFVQHKK